MRTGRRRGSGSVRRGSGSIIVGRYSRGSGGGAEDALSLVCGGSITRTRVVARGTAERAERKYKLNE